MKRADVIIAKFPYVGGSGFKVRPCVVVSVREPDSGRNMSVVVPMTTEIRGGECEVSFPKPAWLKEESVVNLLGIAGVDNAKILRRIGPFPQGSMDQISEVMAKMLGI